MTKRVCTKLVDVDYLTQLQNEETRAKAILFPYTAGPVFAVVKGTTTGLFSTYEEVKQIKAHLKGGVWCRFSNKLQALNWLEQSLNNPSYNGSVGTEIHLSGRCYDVTQEHDTYAAVAMQYVTFPFKTICAQARVSPTDDLNMELFRRVLEGIPSDASRIKIVSDNYKIVYGCNYGLWAWPKHTISGPVTEKEKYVFNQVKQRKIQLLWSDEKSNRARALATDCCYSQYIVKIPHFRPKYVRDQCVMWIICAKRLGVNPDIRRKIAKIVFKAQTVNENILF
jgi:hypothetical protein